MLFRAILLLTFCISFSGKCQGCTCEPIYFCSSLKDTIKTVAIEATVTHHRIYSKNDAVYLSVDKIFRDDVGISTVIKLYGKNEEGGCNTDVLRRFPDGLKVFVLIQLEFHGTSTNLGFTNPDDIFENYWEFAPHLCSILIVDVQNQIVRGFIHPNIFQYPLPFFEQRLQSCDFSFEELNGFRCLETPFKFFPNPTHDGLMNITNLYDYTYISYIRIFDFCGRLVYAEKLNLAPFQNSNFTLPQSGFYIVEYQCEGGIYYEKVFFA